MPNGNYTDTVYVKKHMPAYRQYQTYI